MNPTSTLDFFLRVDGLFAPDAPLEALHVALHDERWELQQAALHALSLRAESISIAPIVDLIARHECTDRYGNQETASPNPLGLTIQKCRYRVKQAACHALAAIAAGGAAEAVQRHAGAWLCRTAINQEEDYPVRAAASGALGHLTGEAVRTALDQAKLDTEWCTAAWARKSLARMDAVAAP